METVIVAVISSVLSVAVTIAILRKKGDGRVGIYIRPHTSKSLSEFPQVSDPVDLSTVSEAKWGRTSLPNSGVDWT